MAEGDKTVHKLDEATKKALYGIFPFSVDQTSELVLIEAISEVGKKMVANKIPLLTFKIRPFTKAERGEAYEAVGDYEGRKEKRCELARKVTKGWVGLFDSATGDEIKYKSNNADGGADDTIFSNLPEFTLGRIFNHAYLISGLSLPEKLSLKS